MPRFTKSWLVWLKWHANALVILIAVNSVACVGPGCSSSPCMYGICVDDGNGYYRCYCIDGYTGINCEINWDDCWSSPCLNGGSCNDAIASYNCTCPEGFVGGNCEQKYSECMNQPCLNNGTCVDNNGFTCQCLEGFSGEFCEIDASVCNSTVCKNFGECVEGPGLTFACRCADGWAGKHCEDDVNECSAQPPPCQNGGLCINVPGTYTCACLFGFTGKDCDKKVVPCEESPCQNNAVCLFEDAQPICYCVPDYHGTFCELRYDDCESKYAQCENGGTCVDGINNFTCSCPPHFAGDTCGEPSKLDRITTSETPNYVTDAIAYTTDRSLESEATSDALNEVTSVRSTKTVDEFETTPFTERSVTGEDSSSPDKQQQPVDSTSSFTELEEAFTVPVMESRTEYEPYAGFSSAAGQDYTTDARVSLIPGAQELTTSPAIDEATTGFAIYSSESMHPIQTPDSRLLTTNFDVTLMLVNDSLSTTPFVATTTTTTTIDDSTTTMQALTSSEVYQKPATSATSRGPSNKTEATPAVTVASSSALTSPFETTTDLTWMAERTTTPPTVTSSVERPVDADYDETASTAFTSAEGTTGPSSTTTITTTRRVVTMLASTIVPTDASSTTVKVTQASSSFQQVDNGTERMTSTPSPPLQPFTEAGSVFGGGGSTTTQLDFTTVTEFHRVTFGTEIDKTHVTSIPTTTEHLLVHSCTVDQCANTSLCVYNATQCDCSYQNNCRKFLPSVQNAAFNGKSYIRQKFAIDDGTLSIFVRLKTKAKSGILIHALFDDERYVLLYMETGQLKFQFSCGLQTMLFGELDSPINNGYDVDVEMRFRYAVESLSDKCSARLLVNGSIAMSGEQVLQTHGNAPQFARLHLGGIPVAFSHQFPQIVMGFVGCMSLLKVNGVNRDFIHDSVEAVQIEECVSFLCLSNPCKNFGACEEVSGKISCKCIAGYSGETCERSICDDNPCYLGATCLISPGANFICICPLGAHGLLCEKDTTIVQPSFSVFSPGFSSYMAYGVSTSIKDSMELKLRIVPQTLEQISLIAYMGQTGSKRETSDHFSITFVRGYLMLTWDLGSGVRRIFTNTPLNVKSHKVHLIQIGRKGRDSWLHVEGIGNITGRAAGTNTRLDVSPILYIGGHKSKYFEILPHDLPLHTGFSGCIYDIELRTDDNVFPVTMSSPATGRGVGECHRNECSHHSCKNGAVCLNYGPTYSCICMKDWEGPDCSSPINCTSSNSLCHNRSK